MIQKTNTQNGRYRSAQPIKSIDDIKKVRLFLHNRPRDLLLFDLVTQSGIKMSQLLKLRVRDLLDLKPGDRIPVIGSQRSGIKGAVISDQVFETFQRYLDQESFNENDYLLKSRKGNKPLKLPSVTRMVKGWFYATNLNGLSGVMTLRKTWEYHCKRLPKRENGLVKRKSTNDVLTPVKVASAQELVFEKLQQAIISGKIHPGQKLSTEEMSKQMGVSRIPVREALRKLEGLGLISTLPNRSIVVNELSEQRLKEILEIRLVNESMAVRNAALNRSEETVQKLVQIHEQYISAVTDSNIDVDKILHVNKQFHHCMYLEAKMPILKTLIDYLWDRISPYLHILMRSQSVLNIQMDKDIQYHENMLTGMRRGDPDMVVRWLEADLKEAAKIIIKLFHAYRES